MLIDAQHLLDQLQALEGQKQEAQRTIERCDGAQQLCRFLLGRLDKQPDEPAPAGGDVVSVQQSPAI